MSNDHPIFAEIEALLVPGSDARLDELEDTLTSGYAAALAFEAERWRIERKIAELAAVVSESKSRGKTRELGTLAERLTATDVDLSRLRGMLGTLRARADEVRAAA